MRDFSEGLRLDKMRSGNAAVYQLKEDFEKFASAPLKFDLCESIAQSFYQLEEFGDAANWYETAGRMILSEPSATPVLKALTALREFEKALECHRRADDEEGFTECAGLIRELRRASASA